MRFLLFLFLFSSTACAGAFRDVTSAAAGLANGIMDFTSTLEFKKTIVTFGPKFEGTDPLSGKCNIRATPNNPISSPCAGIPILMVNTASSHDVLQARTNSEGNFTFGVDRSATYSFAAGSDFYKVVNPQRLVHPGEKVVLELERKP